MRYGVAFLALACALVLFTGLGTTGFLDFREARDAQVARELIASRELLTPVFGSEPLFEKPVFAYVPDAVARGLTSDPVVTSRLIRAVLAVLLVLVTGSIGAVHFGTAAGVCAAMVLATTLALPLAARADGTQLLATLFGWIGVAMLGESLFAARPGREVRFTLGYVALAMALLFGGLVSMLWPFAALALFATLERRRTAPLHLVTGFALIVGLALPWHFAMIERHGAEFLSRAPLFPYAADPRGPWYAGPMSMVNYLVVGLFPWSALLPAAFAHAATGWRTRNARAPVAITREEREERAAHYFIACLVASLATLLIYPRPPLGAILPAAPAAALLSGRLLAHAIEDPARLAAGVTRAASMLALLGTMTAILVMLIAGRLRDVAPELRMVATVVFATAWAPLLASLLRRPLLAAALMTLPVMIGTPVVAMRLLPAMEPYLSTREATDVLIAAAPPLASMILVEPPAPTARLYGENNLVLSRTGDLMAADHAASDGWTYLGFRPARERDVVRALATPIEILHRTPALVVARARSE
jgi:4-amino-4-deoxy-L-arabinose transferase-like glycosyltransferase